MQLVSVVTHDKGQIKECKRAKVITVGSFFFFPLPLASFPFLAFLPFLPFLALPFLPDLAALSASTMSYILHNTAQVLALPITTMSYIMHKRA